MGDFFLARAEFVKGLLGLEFSRCLLFEWGREAL